jgi:probable FeS assembly SUF system protein SufT
MHSYENEPIVVQREVKAVAIPAGVEVNLKLGSVGYITQALGGSFTLYVEGNLYRLPGTQADAIGKDVASIPELPPNATEEDVKQLAWQQMRSCYDPEIPVNIVDLGLVYDCNVTANEDATRDIQVNMTLTAPGCGMGEVLVADVRDKLEAIPTVRRAEVTLSFDPPWSQSMMSDAAKLQTGMMW